MKYEIKICLDEIDECYNQMEKKLSSKKIKSLKGWVRRQKILLKELGYKGKINRQPKLKKSEK